MTPPIALFSLGGTIAMRQGPAGLVPAVDADDLIGLVPDIREIADVTVTQVARVPSADVTIAHLIGTAEDIRAAVAAGAGGIVVVQGRRQRRLQLLLLDRGDPGAPGRRRLALEALARGPVRGVVGSDHAFPHAELDENVRRHVQGVGAAGAISAYAFAVGRARIACSGSSKAWMMK